MGVLGGGVGVYQSQASFNQFGFPPDLGNIE